VSERLGHDDHSYPDRLSSPHPNAAQALSWLLIEAFRPGAAGHQHDGGPVR